MKLDRVIAVRNNKTIYRDGDKCVKVFNEDNKVLFEKEEEIISPKKIAEIILETPLRITPSILKSGKFAVGFLLTKRAVKTIW